MMTDLDRILLATAVSTFENLGFVLPNEEPTEEQRAAALETAVRCDFQGPVEGGVLMAVYGGVLPAIAANMLGSESTPSTLLQADALCELANVLCGNLIPSLTTPEAVCRIGPPHIAAPDESMPWPEAARAQFGLDQGRVEVRLFTR